MNDFNKVNTRQSREKELDDELKALETPVEETVVVETPVEPQLSVEEENWKKRYGDLRTHQQREKADLSKKIAELEAAIESQTKETIKFPKTASIDEVREWANEYPQIAAIVEKIADYKTETRIKEIDKKVSDLEVDKLQVAKERAYNFVLKAHPDFPELVNNPEFQDWVERQPVEKGDIVGGAIFNALHRNETDAQAAIQAVNIYKSETKVDKKQDKRNDRLAAETVSRTPAQAPVDHGGKPTFLESVVESMNIREYERLEDEIDLARREGRFVYDVTGAAR